MNERIRELMHQSNPSGDFSECEWVFENFAELIQQDCLQHLTNTGQDYAREILERYFAQR